MHSPGLAIGQLSHPGAELQARANGRRLAWSLAISLTVHGLAFSPAHTLPAAGSSPPLHASLRQPPAAPRPAASMPPARTEPVTPPATLPRHEPPERIYENKPAVERAVAAATDPSPAVPETGHAAGQPAQAVSGAASAPEAAALQPAKPGIDLGGLRQYHLALGRAATRFRRYPPLAREAGWEGRVSVRLAVSEAGTPLGLRLINSSGFTLLDEAALRMIELAASHTPVPESLRGRPFTIDLAVDYNLQDEQ